MSTSPPPSPADEVAASLHDGKIHLLLAATGSVATIKLPLIITALAKHPNLSIRVILTQSAAHFLPPPASPAANQPSDQQPPPSELDPQSQSQSHPTTPQAVLASATTYLSTLPSVDGIYTDPSEWTTQWTRNSEILHIALRRWAHTLLIAPLSANTLAKIVGGFADNLLTSVVRAWDTTGMIDDNVTTGSTSTSTSGTGMNKRRKGKKILVAPAMNTAMWVHPVTEAQVRVLESEWRWFEVLRPVEKALACGDVGKGGMVEWGDLVGVVERELGLVY